MSGSPPFDRAFHAWAGRVRRRLAFRHALTGLAVGLSVGLVPAAAGWKLRKDAVRFAAPAAGLVGAIAGAAIARRRRWSDGDVALYLDGQLGSEEAIATAVDLCEGHHEDDDEEARAVVIAKATSALTSAKPKDVRPSLLKPVHALAPLAAVGLALVLRAPLPPAPVVAQPPGTTEVRLADVDGLEKVIKLAQVDARDDAQRERLEKLAKDAAKLKEDLAKGMEQREAQDRISRLKESLAEERLSLGDKENRAGLESAVSRLEQTDATKNAAKALGDHDLESMDAEMERIANEREKQDREAAKRALQDAADAAKKQGAKDVAKALEEEKALLEKREKRSAMLRDLADAMKDTGSSQNGDVQPKSEALDREGTDKASKQLAEAMGKALEKMTPEERKRLAERLREMAKQQGQQGGGAQSDPQTLKDLADALSTPEGQRRLEEQLKDLANQDTESPEAKRQKALDDAQKGIDDAQGQVGKQGPQGQGPQGQGPQGQGPQGQGPQGQGPQGQGPQGQGPQGQGPQGQGPQGLGGIPIPQDGQAQGASGHGTHDTGTGAHAGQTGPVNADTLKSRARGPLGRNQGMPGATTTFVPGRAGGTANQRGTGDLASVGPKEMEGVERSDVPQEYRDQVRQYFQP
jgi:hypothetical protein